MIVGRAYIQAAMGVETANQERKLRCRDVPVLFVRQKVDFDSTGAVHRCREMGEIFRRKALQRIALTGGIHLPEIGISTNVIGDDDLESGACPKSLAKIHQMALDPK